MSGTQADLFPIYVAASASSREIKERCSLPRAGISVKIPSTDLVKKLLSSDGFPEGDSVPFCRTFLSLALSFRRAALRKLLLQ